MSFQGQRVIVIGIARSGMAAIAALHKRGATVFAYDQKGRDQLATEADILQDLGIRLYTGIEPALADLDLDMVVVSPGVPLNTGLIQEARRLGIEVIGELELAFQIKSTGVDMYAITGTNGKTTTTALLNDMMIRAGRNSAAGGNIGVALCSLVDEMENGIMVVEVSSFQLETIKYFRPHIAGMLNITPDHLDRHQTMAEYTRVKSEIFSRQTAEDYLILNYEDARVRAFKEQASSQVVFFSNQQKLDVGVFVENGYISISWGGHTHRLASIREVRLRGKHNLENILCATAMAWMAGVGAEGIRQSLGEFKGVRHRLEEVALHLGVLYVNDSKGTNPDSTIKALESFDQPIVLIAGGRAKGGSYSEIARLISARVKELVLVGEARDIIKSAVQEWGMNPGHIHEADDFPSAVYKASQLAVSGDVVLLSPACASWDMFPSYEHRGDLFCQLVAEITAPTSPVN